MASVRVVKPNRKRRRFTCDDVGNAERLVHYCGLDFKYVAAWGLFVVWTGSVWVVDRSGGAMLRLVKRAVQTIRDDADAINPKPNDVKATQAKTALLKWYKASRERRRIEAMMALAKGEPGVEIDHRKLDDKPWLLNVKNGTIDLKTGTLKKANRGDMLTQMVPIMYNPKVKAPRWEAFLKQSLPDDEIREFMQRFGGYCLTGDVGERTFVILYGQGRNGKSVYLKILQKMLGPCAVSTAPGLLMSRDNEAHPTEIADLFRVRLAVASEVRKGKRFDEEAVKRLTGNDELKARRMREDYWEFSPTHKLMLAVNHKPGVSDDSESFWDRVALIPFDIRVEDGKVDRKLLDKLTAELPGILNWAVAGCLAWQKAGLARPEKLKAAIKEYRDSEDKIGKFLADCCDFSSTFKVKNRDLMVQVKAWCQDNGVTAVSDRVIGERLASQGCRRDKVGQDRCWIGVRLRPDGAPAHVTKTGTPLRMEPGGKKSIPPKKP